MSIEAYLKSQQPALYHLFANALATNKWSHAYLLHGYPGQPIKAISLFLAQSLLCESPTPLACGTCLTCQRFQHQDYTDLVIIDGSETSIKKQEVLNLASRFAITGLEKANKQIYLLYQVEAMTPEAINALLKFLEEPQMEIYAFLTTTQLDEVLPTIQSRSQVIHLKPNDPQQLADAAKAVGIDDAIAELLSFECGTVEDIQTLSESPITQQMIQQLTKICKLWIKDPLTALHEWRMQWQPLIEDEAQAKTFIQRWMVLISELGKVEKKQGVVLKSYVKMLVGLSAVIVNPYQVLMQLQSRLNRLTKSTNLSLFLDGMMIELLGVSH
ncbi:MAG: hypothetical protein ACO3H6_03780 [Bacilli bacterium]